MFRKYWVRISVGKEAVVNSVFGVAVDTREYDTEFAMLWLEFLAHMLESPALNFVQVLST